MASDSITSTKNLSHSEKEDLTFLKLMLQENRTDLVSEKEIFKILKVSSIRKEYRK